jgi:hypothetical protein
VVFSILNEFNEFGLMQARSSSACYSRLSRVMLERSMDYEIGYRATACVIPDPAQYSTWHESLFARFNKPLKRLIIDPSQDTRRAPMPGLGLATRVRRGQKAAKLEDSMSARSATLVALTLGILACPSVFAGFRTLEWDPSAGATGYKVHYGDLSGNYATTIDVTNDIQTTQQGAVRYTTEEDLDDCTTWYFAVTAYNGAGESGYSNEVPWLTPMAVNSVAADNPGQLLLQGEHVPVTVSGAGFLPGATVEVNHPDWACPAGVDPGGAVCQDFLAGLRSTVWLGPPTIDCNSIQVLLNIEPILSSDVPALVGEYALTVTNTDDSSATNQQAFEIMKNPARFDINQSDAATTDRLDGDDITWISRLHGTCREDPGTASMPCSAGQVSPDFIPAYDFDGDGWIDGNDLQTIAMSLFGSCWDGASWKASACD